MERDVNFDGIATAFEDAIYGSSKGRIRLSVLWEDMLEGIPGLGDGGLRVLDAGGGAGHLAIRLGQLGNEVVLCEPSREMLERARATIEDQGLTHAISTVHAGIHELDAVVGAEPFDVIACHAVLEWLADPRDALTALARLLKPGGCLSLMFYDANAALLKCALAGEFAAALHEHDAGAARRGWGEGATPLAERAVRGWLSELALTVRSKAGIRIFHDLVHDQALMAERLDDLLALEQEMRRVEPFASLGQHVHVLAHSAMTVGRCRCSA
jgi:S-adenosylmethionine-dependent methyltransferase